MTETLLFDTELKTQRDFWVELLAGDLPPAGPPRACEPPVAVAEPGRVLRGAPSAELSRRLEKLSAGSPFLLFTALAAAVAVCLARYTGSRRIALGTPPLAGPGEESRPNLVVVVAAVEPGLPLRRWLPELRQTLTEAYARQAYPWGRLAAELGIGSGRELPFRLVVSLDALHGEALPAGHDLDLGFAAAGFGARLTDRRGLYRRTLLARFLQHCWNGLEAALADVDRPVGDLPLLSAAERHQLVNEWSATGPAASPFLVHEAIRAQAAASPGAVALVAGSRRMTYEELDRLSGRLAARLAALGIGADDRVGVCLERGCDLVVALLGVLRAGAAYVPLDPRTPPGRVSFVLSDCGAKLLLAGPEVLAALAALEAGAGPALAVPRLDLTAALALADQAEPAGPVGLDALAYVIYTSGSTGRPKGVMVSHRGLSNYLSWCLEAYRVAEGEGAPVHSSIGFDLTVTGLWPPLLCGREVVLLAEESPVEALAALLAAGSRWSLVKITPAHLELLAERLPDPALAGRAGAWIVGGEAWRADLASWWRERAPGARWINEYGPTEAVVGCAVHELGDRETPESPETPETTPGVPIGRAVRGATLFLLDGDGRPVPAGVVGEIYIGGVGVARGYCGRADLTAERFLPDPFGGEGGARLYRTGDLARFLPGGNLEFLGRNDEQVKVRGHRIEPAEIEAALLRHPRVRAAAVVARHDLPGGTGLVAYAVGGGGGAGGPGGAPSAAELQEHLGAELPPYMVPAFFVALDALPLTPNGKLDRQALPRPQRPRPAAGGGPDPRHQLQEALAGLWQEVLGLDGPVGGDESFFALGGHSLLATQLAIRIGNLLGVELPVRVLFDAPTLSGLAAAVEERLRGGAGPASVPIEPAPRGGPLPLSFAQQRLWFVEQLRPGTAAFNIPLAVRMSGGVRLPALRRSLEEVVRRHEVLRTVFPAVEGEPSQRILPAGSPGLADLPEIDLAGLPDPAGEAQRLAEAELRRPFGLERGPLLRARYLRLGAEEGWLLLVLHHAVTDGWSTGVLFRELTALYEAALAEAPAPLPPLRLQYADYAVWQRRRFAAGVMEEHLGYWLPRLQGEAGRPLALPADRPRQRSQSFRGALEELALPADWTAPLRALGRRRGATLFMTLLAAFQVVLRFQTGRDRFLVGTDVANRERGETEGMIGFFVNQLALPADLGGDPTFEELLDRVRGEVLGGLLHQELPFDQLVEALRLPRTLGHATLFQVKLIFQNPPPDEARLPGGLTLAPIPLDNGSSQLDLTLALAESRGALRGWINYSTDLFEAATLHRFLDQLRGVLEEVQARPQARLGELEAALSQRMRLRAAASRQEPGGLSRIRSIRPKPVEPAASGPPTPDKENVMTMPEGPSSKPGLNRFKAVQPKLVSLPKVDLIEERELIPGQLLPLLITPRLEDVDLIEWAGAHRDLLEARLQKHGAILFRGFNLATAQQFESFTTAVCDSVADDNGELPRSKISGRIYAVSYAPPSQPILWHNENTFCPIWPMKLWFFCVQPAREGGETPIVDNRRLYQRIDPRIREKFERLDIMYLRNYGRGLDFDWPTAFQTDDRKRVEQVCRENSIEFEWRGEDGLRTRSVRKAVARHPKTGETLWFNQACLWHTYCMPADVRNAMTSFFREEELTRNCYYGDGSPIEDGVMAEICAAYRETEVVFPWQKGDVIMVDNMLTAHARNPFVPPREILAAMGEMITESEIQ